MYPMIKIRNVRRHCWSGKKVIGGGKEELLEKGHLLGDQLTIEKGIL